MNVSSQSITKRIDLVDALRGFALLAIILLHHIEHYNIYFTPESGAEWLKALDKGMWDISWLLMGGKAFSTFSLLFGFSYYIQLEKQVQRGGRYEARFLWRMVILFAIGLFHSLYYNGDILLAYAMMGIFLIPIGKLTNHSAMTIAVVLLLQPMEWSRILLASSDASYVAPIAHWKPYLEASIDVIQHGNLAETVVSNITDGLMFSNLWQLEAGRMFQIPALFIIGMVLGRRGCFVMSDKSIRFWLSAALTSLALLLLPLNILKNYVPQLITNPEVLAPYTTIFSSWWNFAVMTLLVACFALLWFYKGDGYRAQRFIIPFGRMSLTNYLVQSLIGVAIYWGWGFGLYEYVGSTGAILLGIIVFVGQLILSRWWLAHHKQGPLEWLWKRLTWIKLGGKA